MPKPDREKMADALALDKNRFLLVRPANGLRGGFEVYDVWKQAAKRTFDEKEDALEAARDRARSPAFDYVLEVHEPTPREEDK